MNVQIIASIAATLATLIIPSPADGATRGHLMFGTNATQMTVAGEGQTSISNGYAGYTIGGGFAYIPNPNLVIELNGFVTQRKFGFGDTFASFPTLQFPLTAQYHFWQFHIGGGAYSALWKFNGQMVSDGTQSTVTVAQAGQKSSELGYLLLAGLTQRIYSIPMRFEARRFQSINNLSSKSALNGKVSEWQLLIGLELDTDSFMEKYLGIAKPQKKAKPSEKGGSKAGEPAKQVQPTKPPEQ